MEHNNGIYVNMLHYPVRTFGIGTRVGLWLQGCSLKCDGCMSKHTWERNESYRTDLISLIDKIKKYPTKAITISGGEPFEQYEALLFLVKALKNYGFKDILVYTGLKIDFIEKNYPDIFLYISALVDGKFIKGENTNLVWKGSENQNLYVFTKEKELVEAYESFAKEEEKKIQLIHKNDNIYLIGIPYEENLEDILNGHD